VKRRPPPSIGATVASSPTTSSAACGRLQRCQVKNKRRGIERENERREKISRERFFMREKEIRTTPVAFRDPKRLSFLIF
jgi:hypothetical protein